MVSWHKSEKHCSQGSLVRQALHIYVSTTWPCAPDGVAWELQADHALVFSRLLEKGGVMSDQSTSDREVRRGTSSQDWWQQDKLDSAGWGVAFIWGALVLLAEATGFSDDISWWDGWGVFFTGAGVISLISTLIRLQVPAYRRKWVGSLIWACVMLAIGLSAWESAGWICILVLFAIGVTTLRGAFGRGR